MKYIAAVLFSLGVMAGAFAQTDTTQEGMITCMYLDENTIACFNPSEYDMDPQSGFQQGEPHDSLFEDTEAREEEDVLRDQDDVKIDDGAVNDDQLLESEDDEDLIEKEPNVRLDNNGEVFKEEETGDPAFDEEQPLDKGSYYSEPEAQSRSKGRK